MKLCAAHFLSTDSAAVTKLCRFISLHNIFTIYFIVIYIKLIVCLIRCPSDKYWGNILYRRTIEIFCCEPVSNYMNNSEFWHLSRQRIWELYEFMRIMRGHEDPIWVLEDHVSLWGTYEFMRSIWVHEDHMSSWGQKWVHEYNMSSWVQYEFMSTTWVDEYNMSSWVQYGFMSTIWVNEYNMS